MTSLSLSQGSQEWLDFRRAKIGASDVPIIMKASPWSSPFELWQIKTGKKPEKDMSVAMARGVRLEPLARKAAESHFKIPLEPDVQISNDTDWAIASLDAISIDGDVLVEIKCPGEKNHLETIETKEVPRHYQIQCQWQMYVTGLQFMYYMSFSEESYEIIELKRNDVLIHELVTKAYEFYLCVINNIPPAASSEDRLFINDEAFIIREMEYVKLKKLYDDSNKNLKTARAALLECTDDGNCEGNLLKITWSKPKETIDYKKLISDLKISDEVLSKYRKTSLSFPTISIK
ncbi:MAG: YqaJ viral recombinase family protein [Candidatus Scalindua sp.]